MGFAVLTNGFDPASLGISDGYKSQRNLPPIMGQCDNVRRIERQPRGADETRQFPARSRLP